MIYLLLFLEFLKIGLFSFGGGYGMISMIKETVLGHGWLNEAELLDFIGIAESTPGPIAINMATFIGTSQGGVLGAALATIGVVLPSFVIILLLAIILKSVIKSKPFAAIMKGIRPVIVGLIVGTGAIFLYGLIGLADVYTPFVFDYHSLIIFAVLAIVAWAYPRIFNKPINPLLLIALSVFFGIVLFAF
ncbi:MAG: chromate transporter [Bacteroidia bacterium]|nr:chromate transporter [Bacteroidia bacterium]